MTSGANRSGPDPRRGRAARPARRAQRARPGEDRRPIQRPDAAVRRPLAVRAARNIGAGRLVRRQPARRPARVRARPRERRVPPAGAARGTGLGGPPCANALRKPSRRSPLPGPGIGGTLRVNGRATIVTTRSCSRPPRSPRRCRSWAPRRRQGGLHALLGRHSCARKLWDPSRHVDRSELPSSGEIHRRRDPSFDADAYDAERAGLRAARGLLLGLPMPVPVFSRRRCSTRSRRRTRTRQCRNAFLANHRGEWEMPPKVYVTNYPAGDFRRCPRSAAATRCSSGSRCSPATPRSACRPSPGSSSSRMPRRASSRPS